MPVRVRTIVKKTRCVTVKATLVCFPLARSRGGLQDWEREGARGAQISDPGPGVDCLLYKQLG